MSGTKFNGAGGIPTHIKNPDLVDRRRRQIVDASVRLFIEKGFHRTTTREIARQSGISIGLLYEYVRTKEDVLYLVCDAIHGEVRRGVAEALKKAEQGHNIIEEMIREYFLVCHRMSDHILLVYQETASLSPRWRKKVLKNEIQISDLFVVVLKDLMESGGLSSLDPSAIRLIAHNIVVLGHMWTFRRWYMGRHYSIDEYTRLQIDFILGRLTGIEKNRMKNRNPAKK